MRHELMLSLQDGGVMRVLKREVRKVSVGKRRELSNYGMPMYNRFTSFLKGTEEHA